MKFVNLLKCVEDITSQITTSPAPSRPPRPTRGPATIKESPKESTKEPSKDVSKEDHKDKRLHKHVYLFTRCRRSSINLHPEALASEQGKEEKETPSIHNF